MMLLVPMRGLDIVPKVLVPHSLCLSWITNWSLPVLSCCLLWYAIISDYYFTQLLHPIGLLYTIFIYLPVTTYDMQDAVTPLSEGEAIDLVKTVFASATERDIYTVSFWSFLNFPFTLVFICARLFIPLLNVLQGDRLEITVLNANGTRTEFMELRKDWALPRTVLLGLTNAENWSFMLCPLFVNQDNPISLITVGCGSAFDKSNLKNSHLVKSKCCSDACIKPDIYGAYFLGYPTAFGVQAKQVSCDC